MLMHYDAQEYPIRPATEPVPPDVQQAVDKANTWLVSSGTKLVPYVATCSEGPDEWHLMLVNSSNGDELCRHLRHTKVDGHTMMLLVKTVVQYGVQQHKAGKIAAVAKLAQQFNKIVEG